VAKRVAMRPNKTNDRPIPPKKPFQGVNENIKTMNVVNKGHELFRNGFTAKK
jgi:hypothetical protein